MNIHEALDRACSEVGIIPPEAIRYGKWLKTDTLSGKNGKGDGRVILDEARVTAHNWQTGVSATVWLENSLPPKEKRRIASQVKQEIERQKDRAYRAAGIASGILQAAAPASHPYLAAKGFREEKALVISADYIRLHAGDYLVPAAGQQAIVVPARIGDRVTSVQLIWENGTKKFLFGGEIGGASHRISKGVDTWLCEGFATGLSVRTALKGLKISATVLCCFSASNIAAVAKQVRGRCFIAADNDKPIEQFNGLGAGEYYARVTGEPYGMPPEITTDFNDMHQRAGIFAVQRSLISIMSGRRAA